MSLLFELVNLALKPLLLAKLSFQIGARSISIIVLTWIAVLRFVVCLHLVIIWRLAICAIAGLSLPVRAVTALYRERQLEAQLYRLKIELENFMWDKKELEEKLHVASKERKMMELMIMELEEEHDEDIVRIEKLEGEVRGLKDEIQRLKEIQGKTLLACKSRGDVFDCRDHMSIGSKPYPIKNVRQFYKYLHEDEIHGIPVKTGSQFYGISYEHDIIVAKQRHVAISRSLFSATLSLVVGFVVWEAESSCMPLVVALYMVVTMSLTSVMGLYRKIEHKPALDALALLSLNWFVLGTLSCPLLPRLAHFLAPLTLSFVKRMFR